VDASADIASISRRFSPHLHSRTDDATRVVRGMLRLGGVCQTFCRAATLLPGAVGRLRCIRGVTLRGGSRRTLRAARRQPWLAVTDLP